MTIDEQKKSLRSEIRNRLRTLQYSYEAASLIVYDNLCKTLNFEKSKTIATYIDFNNELPTSPFLPKLFNFSSHTNTLKHTIAVPFCEGRNMSFYRLLPPTLDANQQYCFSDLAPGKFGILEPLKELRNNSQNIVHPNSIEIMLTPGLAFDPVGHRLGRGAGYYDRYLVKTSPDMLIVALAFDCQIVEQVPAEPFDIAVDAIVTPTQVFSISEKFKNSEFTI